MDRVCDVAYDQRTMVSMEPKYKKSRNAPNILITEPEYPLRHVSFKPGAEQLALYEKKLKEEQEQERQKLEAVCSHIIIAIRSV